MGRRLGKDGGRREKIEGKGDWMEGKKMMKVKGRLIGARERRGRRRRVSERKRKGSKEGKNICKALPRKRGD